MNELANELENKGFNTEIKGNKVSIRLGGLSNPVAVAPDLVTGQYVVVTRDLTLGVIYTLLLATSLYGLLSSISFISTLLIAACAFGFTSLIITELRVRPLREVVERLNNQTQA